MASKGLLEIWFEHGPIPGPNVQQTCKVCGATVADWMATRINDRGLRPNQDRHVKWHMGRDERPDSKRER